MKVQPYLFFEGRAEEAINFYRQALGAELEMMMRYKESPEPAMCPVSDVEKIMHATLRVGGTSVMLSDGMCSGEPKFEGIALALDAKDDADADRLFNALSKGGKVKKALGRTFFSSNFGMLSDRFGVSWMIMVGK